MKLNKIVAFSVLPLLLSCGGGTGTEGFTGGTSPKLELFIQNRTLEPNYSPASRSSTLITARLKHQQSGRLIPDQEPGVNWAYSTKDDVDVYYRCFDLDAEPCKNGTRLISYTSKKLVDGYDRILFVNGGTTSGKVEIVATIQDPYNAGNTIASRRGAPISISGGSSTAYAVGAKISGVNVNGSGASTLKPSAINPMVAYVIDEGGSKPRGNGRNNLVVSIVNAPDGTTISGNSFVGGNSLFQEGQELKLSSDFNGEAVFFIQTANLPGDVKLKIVSDRSDNNVDNGITTPVIGYADFRIADSPNTGKISFASSVLRRTILLEQEFELDFEDPKENTAILIPVVGDYAVSCSIVEGSLPPGMSFGTYSNGACYLEGKAEVVGTYESVIKVASARSNEYATSTLVIDVLGKDDFSIEPSSNLGVKLLDEYFSVQIMVKSAGTSSTSSSGSDLKDPAYVKLVSGELPENLTLVGNLISGKLIQAGEYSFSLEVKDGASNRVKTKQFYLRVIDGAIVLVDGPSNGSGSSTKALPSGEVDAVYAPYAIMAEGFNNYEPLPPFVWSLASGTLPSGLELNLDSTSESVVLTGTPTTEGTFIFVLSVKDANGVVGKQTYKITIGPKFDPCTVSPKPAGCP